MTAIDLTTRLTRIINGEFKNLNQQHPPKKTLVITSQSLNSNINIMILIRVRLMILGRP